MPQSLSVQRVLLPPATPGLEAGGYWDLSRLPWSVSTRAIVELLYGHAAPRSVEGRALAVLGALVAEQPGRRPATAAAALAPLDGAIAELTAKHGRARNPDQVQRLWRVLTVMQEVRQRLDQPGPLYGETALDAPARAHVQHLWPQFELLDRHTVRLDDFEETRSRGQSAPCWLTELAGTVERLHAPPVSGHYSTHDTLAMRRASAIRAVADAVVGYPWGEGTRVERVLAYGLRLPDRAVRTRLLQLTPALMELEASADYQDELERRLGPPGPDGVVRLPVRQTADVLSTLEEDLRAAVDAGAVGTPEAWAAQWLDTPPGPSHVRRSGPWRAQLQQDPTAWAGLLSALSGQCVVLPAKSADMEPLLVAAITDRVRAATVGLSRQMATVAPRVTLSAEPMWGDGRGFSKYGRTNAIRVTAAIRVTGRRTDGEDWTETLPAVEAAAVVADGGTAEDGVAVATATARRLVAQLDADLRARVPAARGAPVAVVEDATKVTDVARRVMAGRPVVQARTRALEGSDAVQMLALLAGSSAGLDEEAAGRVLVGAELLGLGVEEAADLLDAWAAVAAPDDTFWSRRRREALREGAAKRVTLPTTPPPPPAVRTPAPAGSQGRRR